MRLAKYVLKRYYSLMLRSNIVVLGKNKIWSGKSWIQIALKIESL